MRSVTGGVGAALPWGTELPFVGRSSELATLREHLARAVEGHGHCVFVTGGAGAGKSRLLSMLAHDAAARGVTVASGSAFAMESSVPFGAVADALGRPLRALDAAALTVLARGAEHDLRAVVPGLPGASASMPRDSDGEDGSRARLLWNVTQFLTRLATRTPLLLVLDNAHESDPSSLELLHFIARHIAQARVLVVIASATDRRDANHTLRGMTRSLLAGGEATELNVDSLTRADLAALFQRSFNLGADEADDHAAALWSHTRGNPFFVDESLKALLAAGRIRPVGAAWVIDSTTPSTLPSTVRDAVMSRVDQLDASARRLADIASIVESRTSLALFGAVSQFDAATIADAIDALCVRCLLVEHRTAQGAEYEFAHPIMQRTVRSALTAAREQALHASVASALEAIHGPDSTVHAVEVARHLVRARDDENHARTLHYLAVAGRDALARRANLEAAQWLGEALAIARTRDDAAAIASLLEDLGTARMRLGSAPEAEQCWRDALQRAESRGDRRATARLLHQLAQHAARRGNAVAGLDLLDDAEQVASDLSHDEHVIRIGIARAKMLQALGRHADAVKAVVMALQRATALGESALLARVHQTALQLYAWTGPADLAREHGAHALSLARASGRREIEWSVHWAMAMLEGFTGDEEGVARHLHEATKLADALASPVLQAMTAEVGIEHASGVGRWDDALVIAERTIPLARAVLPHALLPRLLVWTGLIVLSRDDTERARALFEEAWELSGAGTVDAAGALTDLTGNVHNVILAHTGMGAYFLSHDEWSRALAYGERGLALADQFGYTAWAIHRLIPMIIEASLRTHDYARVSALTARLREQSSTLGHRLGLAWAAAADALVARVKHQDPDAAARLLRAADELDAVPFVFHAARIRRNAAQVLEADGDVEGAVRELRRTHDVFARLGAEFELRGVRSQLRALGVRLPPRGVATGAGALTGRELEIARAVGRRLSNKEIGATLDISARTVSTHLSNIFAKLGVDSRAALADAMRERPELRDEV